MREAHRQPNARYAWLLENERVVDGHAMAYGHGFVILAAASCKLADIESADQTLTETWDFL
ncbi:MAG: AGE family epimerase/isomerase [Granulosicoccus sp.]